MSKTKNTLWRFFASVKLALTTLIILATVSVIGTLIKQGQPTDFYVEEYGQSFARLFEQLGLTNMYSAWWFVALLGLFAINLVVCSIERLPGVWRLVTADILDMDIRRLETMSSFHRMETALLASKASERMRLIMVNAGWKGPRQTNRNGSILYAAQKGAWTRLGVYVVHFSILIILVGAILGSVFGFQAYVFIPEGTSTSNIYLRKNKQPIPLDFQLKCDWFEKTFYPNGMIKQYSTSLSVIDPGRENPYKKTVIVNEPLTYQGLTFYVGDGFPMDEYFVVIRDLKTGMEQRFRAGPEQDVSWQGTAVSFRIEEVERDEDGAALRAKIHFLASGDSEPSAFWINNKGNVFIQDLGQDYSFSYRQLYSTLLLVTRDPGVVIVYFGCGMMVVGLIISFFMSHRRIWILIEPKGQGARILIGGGSNKNKPAFLKHFEDLITATQKDALLAAHTTKKN